MANKEDVELKPGEHSPEPELTVVLPCLNEAETLAACIQLIRRTVQDHGICAEVVVADNGSSDDSPAVAESQGARVVRVLRKGYGSALMGGIAAARGRYIIMGDADMSYDFGDIPRFLAELRKGADLVMGNRFAGGIAPGAMPPLHKYLGNPVLTGIGRILFRSGCGDFHCGLRGFSKAAYQRLGLRTTGMEFASEMVVKASLFEMKVAEVPTRLRPDGRSRPPHLRSWRDGWRHLRFLLLYSPRWLFLYPGLALSLAGLVTGGLLLSAPRHVGHVVIDVHTLLYAAAAVILGFQAIAFAVFTKIFAVTEGLMPEDRRLNRLFQFVTLETGLAAGGLILVAGLVWSLVAGYAWKAHGFGPLDPDVMLRLVIPAVFAIILGTQIIFFSLFLSVLGMHRV